MSRAVTLAGYAVIAVAAVGWQWHTARRRTGTFGAVAGWAARRRLVRWPLIAAWLWLGWHVFAR